MPVDAYTEPVTARARARRARRALALVLLVVLALTALVPAALAASVALPSSPTVAYRPDDDDTGGTGDDDDDDKAGKGGDDDDTTGGKSGGKGGDDDDDKGGDELDKARKAAAAANRELRDLKRQRDDESEKAKKDAGRWEDLYKEAADKLAKLEARMETDAKERLGIAALSELGCKNPSRYLKLLELDDVEDETTAERAAKRLKREEPDLFRDGKTRQVRNGGKSSDDDDDADEDRGGRQGGRKRDDKPGVSRLRRGLEAPA